MDGGWQKLSVLGGCPKLRCGHRARFGEVSKHCFLTLIFFVRETGLPPFSFLASHFLCFPTALLMQREKEKKTFFGICEIFSLYSILVNLTKPLLIRWKRGVKFFLQTHWHQKNWKYIQQNVCVKFAWMYAVGGKSVCLPFFISQPHARLHWIMMVWSSLL